MQDINKLPEGISAAEDFALVVEEEEEEPELAVEEPDFPVVVAAELAYVAVAAVAAATPVVNVTVSGAV